MSLNPSLKDNASLKLLNKYINLQKNKYRSAVLVKTNPNTNNFSPMSPKWELTCSSMMAKSNFHLKITTSTSINLKYPQNIKNRSHPKNRNLNNLSLHG